MLRYKLRKEDLNTLSYRATDNYMDELKAFMDRSVKLHDARTIEWTRAMESGKTREEILDFHDTLWRELAKQITRFWRGEVKPYVETLVLLADEPPSAFVRDKLEMNPDAVLDRVNERNRINGDALESLLNKTENSNQSPLRDPIEEANTASSHNLRTALPDLIHAIENYHGNPEGIYWIGQTLLRARGLLRANSIVGMPIDLVEELLVDIDEDTRSSEGVFDVNVSPLKLAKLTDSLRELL